VAADIPAACEGGGTAFDGVATDVSLGGVFIETEQRPEFGSQMSVVLQVGGKLGALGCTGTVRWSNARGFGMQFGLLGARETHGLIALVADLKGKHSGNGPGPANAGSPQSAPDRASGTD
jgi:type IV pilus assembly protein PilZ